MELALVGLGKMGLNMATRLTRGGHRVGPHGAGHYGKMVHNGIEYDMMQAFADSLRSLWQKGIL